MYTLIKLDMSIPHLQVMVKARVCRVCQKKKHDPGYKKAIDILGKVKARCIECDHDLCGKHEFVIYQTCFETK